MQYAVQARLAARFQRAIGRLEAQQAQISDAERDFGAYLDAFSAAAADLAHDAEYVRVWMKHRCDVCGWMKQCSVITNQTKPNQTKPTQPTKPTKPTKLINPTNQTAKVDRLTARVPAGKEQSAVFAPKDSARKTEHERELVLARLGNMCGRFACFSVCYYLLPHRLWFLPLATGQ